MVKTGIGSFDRNLPQMLRGLAWSAVLTFLGLGIESCSSRMGTNPPPENELEYVSGVLTGCTARKKDFLDPMIVVAHVKVERAQKMFVSPPDVKSEIIAACRSAMGHSVRIGYHPKSYDEIWKRDLEPIEGRNWSLGNHPYVWEMLSYDEALSDTDYATLSTRQWLWGHFMTPFMLFLAFIVWVGYLCYFWEPQEKTWVNDPER